MIRSIKIGETVKCLNCGEAIVIGSETVCFTFDAEYIRCPKCNKVIDMQLYHMYGTKIRKDGGDSK